MGKRSHSGDEIATRGIQMAVNEVTWVAVPPGPEVFHVYHLRRSGGHGVIAWLLGHHQAEKIHYNQCRPDKDSGCILVLDRMIAKYAGTAQKAFELASFEDIPLEHLRQFSRPGVPAILLLRDPFNWFASRLQMIRTHFDKFVGATPEYFRADAARWKEYAMEYMNAANMPQAIRVDFNHWYTDQEYRKHTSDALGWRFTDDGFASRLGWEFSSGSSFGETDPSRLDLLNRWRHFQNDAEFISFFDDDLFDLSKLIFDFTPDLPRRNQSTGASFVVRKQMTRGEALDFAVDLHWQDRYVEAMSIYRQLIASGFQVGRVTNLLAVSLLAMSRVDAAKEAFEQAFNIDPSEEDGINNYLQGLETLGEIDTAISVCRRGLDYRPDSLALHQRLGRYLLLAEQYEHAIQHLRFVIDREPTAHRQLAQLATAYYHCGDEGNALICGANALAERDRQLTETTSTPLPGDTNWLRPSEFSHPQEGSKIIAFSLWGDDPCNVYGALRNAELCEEVYPGWVCRFYCDRSMPVSILNRLQQLGSQVYLMPDVLGVPRDAWRFLVADDPHVEYYVLRECDARLNLRAKAAVDEWLDSGKSFHVMRDAIVHCELVQAGMWGGVAGKLPGMQALLQQFLAGRKDCTAQDFVVDQIWPLIRYDALIHDTYYRYRGKPFPPGFDLQPPLHVGAAVPLTWDPPQMPA
jgi:tetratricopeptide (TPR) repeat protein